MKTTITLKEFSALPSGAAQAADASAPAIPKWSPQTTLESAEGVHIQPASSANEGFREMLHRRYTTPLPVAFPYHHGGLNE